MSSASSVAYLNPLADSITYYFLFVTMPFGFLGNFISIFIYIRPNLNRKTNTGFLYSWLCVTNMIAIAWYMFVFRSNLLFDYTVTMMPCGISNFLRRTTLNAVPWMQAIISFDRFMAVVFPSNRFMKKKVKEIDLMHLNKITRFKLINLLFIHK